MFWPKLSLRYIRKVFPTAASICATGCICSVRVLACKNVWRRGRWVLWLAGVMPAPADRWAELLASSPICPPITEQSARPDNALSAAASHGSPCPLLPSHPLFSYPHCLGSILLPPSSSPPARLKTALELSVTLNFEGFICCVSNREQVYQKQFRYFELWYVAVMFHLLHFEKKGHGAFNFAWASV